MQDSRLLRTVGLVTLILLVQFLTKGTNPWFRSRRHSASPATAVQQQPAPPQPPEEFAPDGLPEDFAASVLGVKPTQVSKLRLVLPGPRDHSPRPDWTWQCEVGGRQYTVSYTGGRRWNLDTVGPPAASVPPKVTLLQARQVALDVVQRRLGPTFYQLEMSEPLELPKGQFIFNWSQPSTPQHSGANARVTIDGLGRLDSYRENPGGALAEAPPLGRPEPPLAPEVFVGGVLGFPAAQVPKPLTAGQGAVQMGGREHWTFEINGYKWTLAHSPWSWDMDLWDFGGRYQPGAPLTMAQARSVALEYVNRRWRGRLNRASPGLPWSDAGTRMYSFSWSERIAPYVQSGNTATVIMYGDGMLRNYREHRAPEGLKVKDVKVGPERARAAADKLVQWGSRAEGRKYNFKRQGLVLWEEQSSRPVWVFEYVPVGTPEELRRVPVRFSRLRVDGLTGAATYR